MKTQIAFVVGYVIWFLGALLFIGNVTGWFPTISYAGFVGMLLGAWINSAAKSTMQREEAERNNIYRSLEFRRQSLLSSTAPNNTTTGENPDYVTSPSTTASGGLDATVCARCDCRVLPLANGTCPACRTLLA